MIIQGRFVGDAPYFPAHLQTNRFEGFIWLLADTGAARSILLDRDLQSLAIPPEALEPSPLTIIGIGGSVRTFVVRSVEIAMVSDQGLEII